MPTTQTSSGQLFAIGWCDETAGVARVSVPGTGVAAHIGRFDIAQTHCIDQDQTVVSDGVATLIAANGDELHMTFEGERVSESPMTFDLVYDVSGGTGRFLNADGELDIRVVFTSPSTWTSSGTGWIQYAASDRSNR